YTHAIHQRFRAPGDRPIAIGLSRRPGDHGGQRTVDWALASAALSEYRHLPGYIPLERAYQRLRSDMDGRAGFVSTRAHARRPNGRERAYANWSRRMDRPDARGIRHKSGRNVAQPRRVALRPPRVARDDDAIAAVRCAAVCARLGGGAPRGVE